MKKLTGILILSSAVLFLNQSCQKMNFDEQDKVENVTVNVELKKNEVYNYTIPTNQSDDDFKITQQALHYNVSELVSQERYTYQPKTDYVGSDQVIIANVEEEHHDGNGHHNNNGGGNCGNHDEETEKIITINFIIKDKPVGIIGVGSNESSGK